VAIRITHPDPDMRILIATLVRRVFYGGMHCPSASSLIIVC